MAKISACCIVKNEAANMPTWFDCVKNFADEIIVVDTGSVDNTVEQAEKAGAQVYHFTWIGDFAAAKNYALSKATGDWIVFLDADEYFPAGDAEKVRSLIEKFHVCKDVAGLFMRMDNIDKDTQRNMGTSFYQLRVFRLVPWLRYEGRIHEYLKNFRKEKKARMVYTSEVVIFHTGYSEGLAKQKAERNLAMIKENQAKYGANPLDDCHLADCYYILKQWPEAAYHAQRAVDNHIKPLGQENRPYGVLIESLLLSHASDEAIHNAIQNAIAIYPDNGEFWMLWGLWDWSRKDKQAAKMHMEKGLALFLQKKEEKGGMLLADLCVNLLPAMYLHLGQIAFEEGDRETALNYFMVGLKDRRYDNQLLTAFLQAMPAEDTVAVIAKLNRIYNREKDAKFLMPYLLQSPHKKACLYYDRGLSILSKREKYLLGGRIKEAAADLMDEVNRYARIGIVYGEKLPSVQQNMLGAILPVVWHEKLAGKNKESNQAQEILSRTAAYLQRIKGEA